MFHGCGTGRSRGEVKRKINQISSHRTTRSTVFRRTKRETERLVPLCSVPSHVPHTKRYLFPLSFSIFTSSIPFCPVPSCPVCVPNGTLRNTDMLSRNACQDYNFLMWSRKCWYSRVCHQISRCLWDSE